jgi:hypothetical protein
LFNTWKVIDELVRVDAEDRFRRERVERDAGEHEGAGELQRPRLRVQAVHEQRRQRSVPRRMALWPLAE